MFCAHQMVYNVRGGGVSARVAKPLVTNQAPNDGCRRVNTTVTGRAVKHGLRIDEITRLTCRHVAEARLDHHLVIHLAHHRSLRQTRVPLDIGR